jgi:ABC-type transport system involved in multi-copper enzyme maturation permease subunit
MLLGPVFRAELVRTPRRRRYYSLRVIYGIVLIFLIWANYQGLENRAEFRGGKPSIDDMSRFAETTFTWFASVQLGTILLLVPALFGGVIADEKQRKTMHYLMASRLSSAEIVLDKLAARLVHIGAFILLGLPVMSLLTLFGGVAWDYVAGAYLGTFSITFFAASFALLVSTFARRVRQGVVVAYVLIIAWLVVPPLADGVVEWLYPNVYQRFRPVSEWILNTGPLGLSILNSRSIGRVFITSAAGSSFLVPSRPSFLELYCWMIGLQAGASVLFLLVAAWRLRPVFRRQEESQPRRTWFATRARPSRWLNRPECGSDAMLWKERHFARTDVFTKLVLLPATIILTVYVILGARFDETVVHSFSSVWRTGYAASTRETLELHDALCATSPLYLALWMLAAAGAAASSVTVEREQDTWDSLTSTPLSGWQIVRGKSLGALWGLRGFGALVGVFWIVGLAAGAIHPIGLLLALIEVAILTWFVIALGMHASLNSKKTSRALTATIAVLIGLNIGYLGVLYPIVMISGRTNELAKAPTLVGCTPVVASYSLLSYSQVAEIFDSSYHPGRPDGFDWRAAGWRAAGYAAVVLLGYALAAMLLTRRSVRRFDRLIDRPRKADAG